MAHQADAGGLLRLDDLGGEDQLHSVGHAHNPGQPLGAAEAGGDAQAHLGLAELGLLAGQPDVAGHGQLAAAPQGEAVDGGDGGLGQVLQLQENPVAVGTEGLALHGGEAGHLADVRPGHKGPARPGDNGHQDLRVILHLIQHGVQVLQHLLVQGVEGLGPIHGNNAHRTLLLKCYKSHRKIPPCF